MKLLFDENLSRKLVARLAGLYPQTVHVSEIALTMSPDRTIWDYAAAQGYTIVTADSDYFELATRLGPPPKVVWLRRWVHPTRDVEVVMRREAIRIARFIADTDLAVLILDKD